MPAARRDFQEGAAGKIARSAEAIYEALGPICGSGLTTKFNKNAAASNAAAFLF